MLHKRAGRFYNMLNPKGLSILSYLSQSLGTKHTSATKTMTRIAVVNILMVFIGYYRHAFGPAIATCLAHILLFRGFAIPFYLANSAAEHA